jgi:membrane protein
MRTLRSSWEHEVFGQAARLAFYYFMGIFPALLLLLVLLNALSGTGHELRSTLLDCIRQLVPPEAAALLSKTVGELNTRATVATGALWAVPSGAWAIFNGIWAMMVGLNNAYEVKEERPWWKILSIGLGLTIWLGVMGLASLAAMLYGGRAEAVIARNLDWQNLPVSWHVIQWLVIILLLLVSFTFLYRFGPNLKDRRWQWSTPGAVVAVVWWGGSILFLRISQEHFSSTQRIYAELKPVVALLLWLYFTGAAIFIGGEINSEIEKAATETGDTDVRKPGDRRSGGTRLDADVS